MPNLVDMEREAKQFGVMRGFAVGQHLVQVAFPRDPYSRNGELQYYIGGWRVDRSKVEALLAGQPAETVPSYAELLAEGGLKVGPVTSES